MMADVIWPFFGNKIGCFSLYSILDCLILPPTLIISWSSKKGSNLKMLVFLETHFWSSSLLISFWKQLCWYILIIENSLLCKRFISTSYPVVLILFDLIMFSSISLNLSIVATTHFISDEEEVLSNLPRVVVLDEVRLVFKVCFTSGSSSHMS